MYVMRPTTRFQKDVKLACKRGYPMDMLSMVLKQIAAGEPLTEKHKDHQIYGKYKRCRECHVTPDWLLIYEVSEDEATLFLVRTGTHSDLFR